MRTPERDLWATVLLFTVIDACNPPRPKHIRKDRNGIFQIIPEGPNMDTRTARSWLLSKSRDMKLICDWAGLDPEAVWGKIKQMEQNNWPILNIKSHDPVKSMKVYLETYSEFIQVA